MRTIENLLEIMATLRDAQNGCPWDQRQTFASIAPYTIEEAYEVADAIAREDPDALRHELGDLLFQVVFHARMAEEADQFDFSAVVDAICEKMLRRHPHVFGSESERQQGAQAGSWERIKAQERAQQSGTGTVSAVDGIALSLPALKRAEKLGKRASRAGFDWPDTLGVHAKIDEEFRELDEACRQGEADAITEELGDVLFAVVNLARHLKVDPEQALSSANRKFEGRFRGIENAAGKQGRSLESLDLAALEALWLAQKQTES
ncbi:MAG: nucleoside triphosphate pyrophosphohydrolase [Gammaproteobacteria bacterium]|nr:nucleoside triphosphate pyrophosphohydrolase [Gammaproteobacteria bacterium]